jgi:hypothetical protein
MPTETKYEEFSRSFIASIETDKISLEVFECRCGFHLGLDASFLDQVKELTIKCPSCTGTINTYEGIQL